MTNTFFITKREAPRQCGNTFHFHLGTNVDKSAKNAAKSWNKCCGFSSNHWQPRGKKSAVVRRKSVKYLLCVAITLVFRILWPQNEISTNKAFCVWSFLSSANCEIRRNHQTPPHHTISQIPAYCGRCTMVLIFCTFGYWRVLHC